MRRVTKFFLAVSALLFILLILWQPAIEAETTSSSPEAQQHYIDGMFHWTQAVMNEDESEYSIAINEFKQAIKKNPDFADAYFQLGVVYKQQGKNDEAKKMWNKAIKLDPDFSDKIKDVERPLTDVKKPIDIDSIATSLTKGQKEVDKISEVTSLLLEAQALLFKGMKTGENKYYDLAVDNLNKAAKF